MHRSLDSRVWKTLPVILLLGAVLIGLGGGSVSTGSALNLQTPNSMVSSGIRDFKPVSTTEGWLLLGNQLYWTSNGGSSWREITPRDAQGATLASVEFIDPSRGWAVLTYAQGGDPVYLLDTTADGGRTWQSEHMPLFASGDPAAFAEKVFMQWRDSHTGWLVVQEATGVNFSVGTLFRTTDGGRHWAKLPLPIGDPVAFVTDQVGWVAGGAAGDELYHTRDGGRTWQAEVIIPAMFIITHQSSLGVNG